MLALSRKIGESIYLTTQAGEVIKVTLRNKSGGGGLALYIDAPKSVKIDREEVHKKWKEPRCKPPK